MHTYFKILLFWTFFLLTLSLSAQDTEISNPKIDSLEALLQKNPSEKQVLKIWAQLAQAYHEVDFKKSIAYAEKMIAWAEQN